MTGKYFTLSDVSTARFYRMPKFLFEGNYKGLSNDARVLYAMLIDRLDLSRRNKWADKQGAAYLIYTREDMCSVLGCSQPTVRRAVHQLKETGLINERRQRINMPNLIYLCHSSTNFGQTTAAARFYRIPKFLFEGNYKCLSNDARALYALLMDRLDLSRRNKWVDKQGATYLIYTREDMCAMLGCSQPTVRRAIRQLKETGIIDERRQRFNRPNLIYLCHPPTDYLYSEKTAEIGTHASRALNSTERIFHSTANEAKDSSILDCKILSSLDCKDLSVNDTDINNTDINDTDNHSIELPKKKKKPPLDSEKYIAYKELIKENIEYKSLIQDNRCERRELEEMLDIMTDAICSTSNTIRVNRENMPADFVKKQLLKLDSSHIEYVFDCLDSNTTHISNIRAYLLSALYNAPSTISNYYRAAVNHDLYSQSGRKTGTNDTNRMNYDLYSNPRLYQIV